MEYFDIVISGLLQLVDTLTPLIVSFNLFNIFMSLLLVYCSYRFILSPILGGAGSDSVKKFLYRKNDKE